MNTLKTAWQAAGLTAAALAEIAGTNEMRLYAISRRRYRPRPDEARRIAEVLRIDPAKLFPDLPALAREVKP